jgi:DNA adenine methylase
LLARCVKASVRYNATGDFNQSPDNRRLGRQPRRLQEDILAVSILLQQKTTLTCVDYKEILALTSPKDLVYLDPPYQGVCTTGTPRYISGMDFDELMQELKKLHDKDVPFILSYDGRTGQKRYGQLLPKELGLYRFEIEAGCSTQATLLGRHEVTYESVYVSKNWVAKRQIAPVGKFAKEMRHQPVLF